ncbi:MAG: alpha/beta fold hydrolase [Pirellulales bacterium]|nr:alpha/beta fold hydrolase [Pirellulales bacterium]
MNSVAEDRLPYSCQQWQVAGHTQSYLDEGSAEGTLLCVHGNPTWSYYWRSVVERFRDDYRVVVPDHLGCGRSEKPPRGEFDYRLASHRDNLVALIDHLDLRNITLVAHDWGGAIGLSAMLCRRDRLKRIVLLNTGAFPPPYVPLRIAACRIPLLGTLGVRGLNLFARAAVTMAMSRNKMPDDVAAALLAPYDSWHNRVAIDAFVRDIPLSQRHPTHATLAQLESELPQLASVPSLLIWGMKDWCFRAECLRRFQSYWPDAKTVEIADAGHYVMEDAKEETLNAMDSFFQSRLHFPHTPPTVSQHE